MNMNQADLFATGEGRLQMTESIEPTMISVRQTWPQGWDGDGPTAATIMDTVYANGAVQARHCSLRFQGSA